MNYIFSCFKYACSKKTFGLGLARILYTYYYKKIMYTKLFKRKMKHIFIYKRIFLFIF